MPFFLRLASTFCEAGGLVPPVPAPAQRLGLLKVVLSIVLGLSLGASIRHGGQIGL
jgi:hypothetical protein